jgi:dihydroflavonol-4-reductase
LTTVLVTGGTGFIAQHCIQQLLRRGCRVRTTVRDLSREQALRAAVASNESESLLGVAAADLTRDEGWQAAVDGVEYVLHTASPVPVAPPRDESQLIIPALEGTRRVLEASARAGVRRVVHTSSIAAVLGGVERVVGATFTEADWSNPAGDIQAYARSKTLAERAAWEFQASLPASQRFELCTVNPVYVIGPSLDGHANASNEIIRKLIDREIPGLPRLYFPLVDVRDVATAHLLAMTNERAAGERFILSAHDVWYSDIAAVLRTGGHRVPTRGIPDWLVHVLSWFSGTVRRVIPGLGWEFHASSEKARRILGWETRPLQETVLDTATSILSRRGK